MINGMSVFDSINTEPLHMLAQPATSLIGVTEKTAEVLMTFNIRTIQDLASSSIFNLARQITDAASISAGDNKPSFVLPSDLIDRNERYNSMDQLAEKPISIIYGIGKENALTVKSNLNITTIRELARWAPFLEARKILEKAYGVESPINYDTEAPEDLIPANGRYPTERVQYEVLLFDEFVGGNGDSIIEPRKNSNIPSIGINQSWKDKWDKIKDILGAKEERPLGSDGPLDITEALGGDQGYDRPAIGGVLTFTQSWYGQGLALGTLIHSIALAPGESTKIAMIDWTRSTSSSTSEEIGESESLYSSVSRSRAISEITNSVARDTQEGKSGASSNSSSSQSGGATGSSTYGFRNNDWFSSVGGFISNLMNDTPQTTTTGTSWGVASANTVASSWSTSSGERDIAASMLQNINDRTQQAAQSVRSRRASIVQETSQKENETITTRTITNYNHMHAMTVQYYEVVQLNRTVTELSDVHRCVFVPMKLMDFSDARLIDRFRMVIAMNSLKASVRALALAEPGQIIFHSPCLAGTWDSANLTALNKYLGYCVGASTDPVLIFPQSQFSISDVFFDKNCPFSEIIVTDTTGAVIRLPLRLEDGEAGGPLIATLHLTKYEDFKLTGIKKIEVRKKETNKDYSGKNYVGLFSFKDMDASWFGLRFEINVPKDSECFTILELQNTIATNELVRHLNDNKLYYSQKIWHSLDPATLGILMSRYTWNINGQEKPLIEIVDPIPVSMVANYLVFRISGDNEAEKTEWMKKKRIIIGSKKEDLVPVPGGGVFGEAVLGRYNSAEKLDITRFWNWQDSPIPIQAPDIAAVQAGQHETTTNPVPSSLGQPVLNIVNPPALPDPQGMSAILAAIQNGNMFRDMSGLVGTLGLAQAGLNAAQQGATNASNQAGMNAQVAAQLNEKITGAIIQALTSYLTGGKSMLSGGGGSNPASMLGGISGQGAKINQGKDMDKRNSGNTSNSTGSTGQSSNGAKQSGAANPHELSAFQSSLGQDSSGVGTGAIAQADYSSSANNQTASDANDGGISSIPSDKALLDSKLVTDPSFTDVTGFVFLLQAVSVTDLIPILIRRFESIDPKINALAKYNELVSEIQARRSSLDNSEQILFATEYVKTGILPDVSNYDEKAVSEIMEEALYLSTIRCCEFVSKSVNPACFDIVQSILNQANKKNINDINHIAYILATAHHESNMGKNMIEIGEGKSTDTVFTRDAYFFNYINGKKSSYNGVNGNELAGNQLQARGILSDPAAIALWNGAAYPGSQPEDVKLAARECDFYTYIGRGLVQVTGRGSYGTYSNRAETNNEDFVTSPENITIPDYAAAVLILGTEDGLCGRGHKLSDYDKTSTFDALNARDVVNGDKNHIPTDADGNPIGIETFGQRIRRIANDYKHALLLFPNLDESRRIV